MVQICWSYLERMMSYRADKPRIDARTDTQTDRQTQATTIPEGQNWPGVKIPAIETGPAD